MEKAISLQTLQRLPLYLDYIKTLDQKGTEYVSAKKIADALGLGEIQVRKDLASVSSRGKPKVGYRTHWLILDIETFLGYNDVNDAVLVGAGKLGKALLGYDGFQKYGLNIIAAFDTDDSAADTWEGEKPILPIDRLAELCSRMKIHIGIITVPAEQAQEVCDMLVESGVLAIWNFAPTHLRVPEGILVKSENMAAQLAELSKHLREKLFE